MKTWKRNDIYNFYEELNRIEGYVKYCQEQFDLTEEKTGIVSKTDWTIYDIVDVKDLNRVKNNINEILQRATTSDFRIGISSQVNQNWTYAKANELEYALGELEKAIALWQYSYEIVGLSIVGNFMKLGGVD